LLINLNSDNEAIHFRLKESTEFLKGVAIVAGAFEAGDEKRGNNLTAMEIATTAGALGDIVGAINTLPGNSRVGESGRLFVRGGESRESRTFIDGMAVQVPYHTGFQNIATRGRFNPFLFSGTIFNTGGYSAEFGQALSSVLLLNTLDEKADDEVNLSLMSVGSDITATKRWESGSITGSASYINMAPYLSFADANITFDHAPEYFSNEFSVKQKAGKDGLFKFYSNLNSGTSSIIQKNLDGDGDSRTAIDNSNLYLNSSWKKLWSPKINSFHGISFVRNNDQFDLSGLNIETELNAIHVKNTMDYAPADLIDFRLGVELNRERHSRSIFGERDSFVKGNVASFAEANIRTDAKIVLRPGMRWEYASYIDEQVVMPRFSAAYLISEKKQISFAFGQFFQEPDQIALFENNQLTHERSDHYILSFQTEKNQRLFKSEIYHKNYRSLVKFDLNDGLVTNLNNTGDGYARGLDLFFRDRKTIRNGNYWISYSYLDTERNFQNFPTSATPAFASRHNLSVVYKHWFSSLKSQVGVDFGYTSPRYFNDPNTEAFNDRKIKSTHQVNLSWAYIYRSNFIFFCSASNLLGTKNEFGTRFSNQKNNEGVFAEEPIRPFANRFFVIGAFYTISKDKSKNQLDQLN
ncbi:MAG: TonB-dependent receptor, partial [Bacteroidota bacterium]